MLSLLAHLLCAWAAFALPAYATYKALAHAAPPDALRALAAHWAVVGAFVALEQALGPLLSWLPFYWEVRTIFLLYVSLPYTNGAVYVYESLLAPWLSKNEHAIDDAMASAQSNAVAFCRTRIASLLDLVRTSLNKPESAAAANSPLNALWATYGPSVVAAFAPKDTHADN